MRNAYLFALVFLFVTSSPVAAGQKPKTIKTVYVTLHDGATAAVPGWSTPEKVFVRNALSAWLGAVGPVYGYNAVVLDWDQPAPRHVRIGTHITFENTCTGVQPEGCTSNDLGCHIRHFACVGISYAVAHFAAQDEIDLAELTDQEAGGSLYSNIWICEDYSQFDIGSDPAIGGYPFEDCAAPRRMRRQTGYQDLLDMRGR